MKIPVRPDLKRWIKREVARGSYPSEEALLDAALDAFRQREPAMIEEFLDLEFMAFCDREGDDAASLEEILELTSKIPDSMAETIINEERADRF